MRRLLLAALLLLAPASLGAQTLTTGDIIGLTKAGLGEEVLLALIEVHRPVFPVDADTMKMLKAAGVPQNVIVAMVRSGREAPLVESVPQPELVISTPAPPPQVVVIDHPREESRVREVAVPVAVPVYVPVRVDRRSHVVPARPVEPVFWGFGGKLRPDAWKPADSHHKPFMIVESPQKK
jgi:hypothetical protein